MKMNLENRITSQYANRRFTEALKEAEKYGAVVITNHGKPAYVLSSYEAYLEERNYMKVTKEDLIKEAKNGGTWVCGKYLMVDILNLTAEDKAKAWISTKVMIDENGNVDLIEIRNGLPVLKCFSKEQIEFVDGPKMPGISFIGGPYNKMEFEKCWGGKKKYLDLFLAIKDLSKEEFETYSDPGKKHTLPRMGIVPRGVEDLLEKQ
ncbi:MAG: type II toxin-antitoxin system prevent-host-death family antitoxin [Clostridiaceae bacterium]|nr:type II toxin-antitoxin system prevent-host-death family antitoxin [Clostridiaceae bacterium]